jgi:hypothetical protein
VVRGCIIIYHYLLRRANYLISFPLKQFAAASSVDTSTGAKGKECVSAGGGNGSGKLTRPHDVASLRLHHKRRFHTTLYTRFAGNEKDYWHGTWKTVFKCNENTCWWICTRRSAQLWRCLRRYTDIGRRKGCRLL